MCLQLFHSTVDRDIDFIVPDQAQAIKIARSNHRPLSINGAGYCSKCPKRTDDELDMFETPGAIAHDTSLLLAERSKKRGWKRQKTQKAFIRIVNAGSGISEKDFPLWVSEVPWNPP